MLLMLLVPSHGRTAPSLLKRKEDEVLAEGHLLLSASYALHFLVNAPKPPLNARTYIHLGRADVRADKHAGGGIGVRLKFRATTTVNREYLPLRS